jgi:hypothetical protein
MMLLGMLPRRSGIRGKGIDSPQEKRHQAAKG